MSFRKDLRSAPVPKKKAPPPAPKKNTTTVPPNPPAGSTSTRIDTPILSVYSEDPEGAERVEDLIKKRKPTPIERGANKKQKEVIAEEGDDDEPETPRSKVFREARDAVTGSQWDNLLKRSPRTCAKSLPGILARAAATAQIASSYITACTKVDVEGLSKEVEEWKGKYLMEEKRGRTLLSLLLASRLRRKSWRKA